jgi:hypothetical protein
LLHSFFGGRVCCPDQKIRPSGHKEAIMAILEKKALSLDELESQMAIELPNRDTLATAVISCLAVCTGNISISDISVNVANGVCAQVGAIANILSVAVGQNVQLGCAVRQSNH